MPPYKRYFTDAENDHGKQTARITINCSPEFKAEVKAAFAGVGGKSLNTFLKKCLRLALRTAHQEATMIERQRINKTVKLHDEPK